MTRVLLITVDSLRADHCSEEYLPNLWPILEREFDRFTRAYSHGIATPFAFPGIIGGFPPEGDGSLPESPTLGERSTGRSVAFANNPHLRPERGYDRGFNSFSYLGGRSGRNRKQKLFGRLGEFKAVRQLYGILQDMVGSFWGEEFEEPYRPAAEQVRRIESVIEDDVVFCWGHFQDPHLPFTLESAPDRDLNDRFDATHIRELNDRYAEGNLGEDDREMSELLEVYGENVRYFDRQLSKLFESLADEGWFEDGIIAITADHGEVFGEHGLTNHPWDAPPVDELVNVPLFVSTPSTGAKTYDHLVQHSDLYQTLGEFLDGDSTTAVNRFDLYDEGRRRVISKSNTSIQCITPDGRIMKDRSGTLEVEGQVTESDREYLQETAFPQISKSADIDSDDKNPDQEEVAERLKALGYIE